MPKSMPLALMECDHGMWKPSTLKSQQSGIRLQVHSTWRTWMKGRSTHAVVRCKSKNQIKIENQQSKELCDAG